MIVVTMKEMGMVGLKKRLNGSTLMIVCVYMKGLIITVCRSPQKRLRLRSEEFRGDRKKNFQMGIDRRRWVLHLNLNLYVTSWKWKEMLPSILLTGHQLSFSLVSGFLFDEKSQPHCYFKEKQKAMDMNSLLEKVVLNPFVNLK